MKQLLYVHARIEPLALALGRAVTSAVSSRLFPALSRLLPGARGRRLIGWILLAVSLVVQVVCLWLLGELVSLCIDLAELWAILARKYVEINP
jgi:hypothetical protein